MRTAGTSLRGIARLDKDDFYATARGLVGDHLPRLGETPIVDAFCLPILPNPVEVFENDPLMVGLRVGDNLFADATVGVRDETSFSARDTLKRPFGALTAVGLKRSSGSLKAGFLVANLLRRVKLLVGGYGDSLDAGDQHRDYRKVLRLPAPGSQSKCAGRTALFERPIRRSQVRPHTTVCASWPTSAIGQ